MSASYSGDPAASARDAVRFLIRDTSSPFHLNNEEIDWLLTEENSNTYAAAAAAARQVSVTFAARAQKSVGDLSISYGEQARTYADIAAKLDARANRTAFVPTPYAGGITDADKQANADDDALVAPAFRRGVHDNLGAGRTDADAIYSDLD